MQEHQSEFTQSEQLGEPNRQQQPRTENPVQGRASQARTVYDLEAGSNAHLRATLFKHCEGFWPRNFLQTAETPGRVERDTQDVTSENKRPGKPNTENHKRPRNTPSV